MSASATSLRAEARVGERHEVGVGENRLRRLPCRAARDHVVDHHDGTALRDFHRPVPRHRDFRALAELLVVIAALVRIDEQRGDDIDIIAEFSRNPIQNPRSRHLMSISRQRIPRMKLADACVWEYRTIGQPPHGLRPGSNRPFPT